MRADVIECADASNYMCILLHVQQGALTKESRGKIYFGLHSRGGTRFLDVEVARLV